jgi:hypothetical protein
MTNELFVILLTVTFAGLYCWAFRVLPREQWQIIAAVPKVKTEQGEWRGMNLTFYGFFQATSNTIAVMIAFVLLGSIGVTIKTVLVLTIILFALCWPASKLIARAVEGKKHTFTIGGALFVGVLTAPWIIEGLNRTLGEVLGERILVIPGLAALGIAYTFGEGLGRLACISFGCCYGKRLDRLPNSLRWIFAKLNFTFSGATKKVSYEGHLEGVRVAPIQAVTAVLLTSTGLLGTYLFLRGYFGTALVMTIVVTQIWRFLSEALRADVRGNASVISAYQVMALLMIAYGLFIAVVFSGTPASPQINAGLALIWDPVVLVFCEALWLAVFLITGRSMVTGSVLSFFVHRDRI